MAKTKFERAKAQTIVRWEYKLLRILGLSSKFKWCGFCIEYGQETCRDCPVYLANGSDCCGSWYRKIHSPYPYNEEVTIANCLAVLTWLHSLTEEGCIRPETK